MSSRHAFRTYSRYVLRSSSRRLEDNKMLTGKESISVSNKYKSIFIYISDKSLSNKPISNKYKANPRKSQDALIRTQEI